MANVELVIKIDEEYIKQIDRIRFLIGGIEDRSLQINVINAIKNGTSLPKEHGRLIDADEIIRLTNEIEAEGVEDKEDRLYYLFLKTVLKDAPTIIEAESEE